MILGLLTVCKDIRATFKKREKGKTTHCECKKAVVKLKKAFNSGQDKSSWVVGNPEPIPVTLGMMWKYTLNGLEGEIKPKNQISTDSNRFLGQMDCCDLFSHISHTARALGPVCALNKGVGLISLF